MLSNTNPQPVNRRQNSNPDIHQLADSVISLPAQPRPLRTIASKGHRRGQSLDLRLFSQSPRPYSYQEAPNSAIMTNQGQHPSQQPMQETQTPGLDRPGRDIQQQIIDNLTHNGFEQHAHQSYHPQPQYPLSPTHNIKSLEVVDPSKFAAFPDPYENPFNLTMSKIEKVGNGHELYSNSFLQNSPVISSPTAMSRQSTNFHLSDGQARRGSVQSFHSMPNTCPSTPKRQSTSKNRPTLL